MEEINQFFDSRNTVYHISEEDKAQLGNYLEAIDAFSRITYKSIYVIDYEAISTYLITIIINK
ncbi:hypothetical protein [Bergeyella zoohelcum]|uniref:hypothetical protein n=1 Tax=Bergeyella zoohelcum TaxID=1015 RepID=UPI002A91A075|nr:hypothetical protein [Bergeyella zoohelcum]MDY6025582.1 hypothetical protein [Bergeyella zoohelcum]